MCSQWQTPTFRRQIVLDLRMRGLISKIPWDRTESDYDIRNGDASGLNIDQTEDKRRQRESAQTERCRVCKLAKQMFMRFRIEIGTRGSKDCRLVSLRIFTYAIRLQIAFTVQVVGSHR